MGQTRDFLVKWAATDSFLMVILALALLFVVAISCVFIHRHKFESAWNEMYNSLVDELNTKGLKIASILIEIATISADVKAALELGEIRGSIQRQKNNSDFYEKLHRIIEKIHDNNHTITLNSDYARARNSITQGVALVNEFNSTRDYKKFASLAVRLSEVVKNISEAVDNLSGILYGLRPHEDAKEESTETVVLS